MKAFSTAVLAVAICLLAVSPALAQHMRPKDVDALPVSPPMLVEAYGADPLQVGELRLPPGRGPFAVAMVIHGGCWTKGYAQRRNTAALADALTKDGIATWNIDYRQAGDVGGGWPATFQDWAAGADHLRDLAARYPLDLKRVVTVGHSAGAHAALWLAARPNLPGSSPIRGADPLKLKAAVAIDGPGDLGRFVGVDAKVCGKPVIAPFMGGTPGEVPDRYNQGSPVERLPLQAPQYLVASAVLAPEDAAAYRARAAELGDTVHVLTIKDGGHFDIIAPATKPGGEVKAFVETAISAP